MAKTFQNVTHIQKHDIEANWNLAKNFHPAKGQLIIYDKDSEHDYVRIKVGDGTKTVGQLDFFEEEITNEEIDEICITRKVGCYIFKAPGSADFTVNQEPYDPNREYTPDEYVDICLTDEYYIEDYYNISVIDNSTGEEIGAEGIHGGNTAVEIMGMPADGVTVNFARPKEAPYIAKLTSSVGGNAVETRIENLREDIPVSYFLEICYFDEGDTLHVVAQYEDIEAEQLRIRVTASEYEDDYDADYNGNYEWTFIAPAHDIAVEIMYK